MRNVLALACFTQLLLACGASVSPEVSPDATPHTGRDASSDARPAATKDTGGAPDAGGFPGTGFVPGGDPSACPSPAKPTTLARGANDSDQLGNFVIDSASLYYGEALFKEAGQGGANGTGSVIVETPLAGGASQTLLTLGATAGGVGQLFLAPPNLFFSGQGVLKSIPETGGSTKTWGANTANATVSLSGSSVYVSIAASMSAGGGPPMVTKASFTREGLDGSDPTALPIVANPVFDLQHIYYTDAHFNLARMDLDGSNPTIVVPIADGGLGWSPVGVDATRLYFTDLEKLYTIALGGGSVTVLTKLASFGVVGGFAVDGTHAYWTEQKEGTLSRIPVAGGSAVALASGQMTPGQVVVDSHCAYWASSGQPFTIQSIPK